MKGGTATPIGVNGLLGIMDSQDSRGSSCFVRRIESQCFRGIDTCGNAA